MWTILLPALIGSIWSGRTLPKLEAVLINAITLVQRLRLVLRVKIDFSIGSGFRSDVASFDLVAGPHQLSPDFVAGAPPGAYSGEARRIESRAFTSYKARIKMQARLLKRAWGWNSALVALATSTTVASVALLSDPTIFGPKGPTVLAALAIVSLVLSLVVSNVDYGARAANAESNYKLLQRISLEAERLAIEGADETQMTSLRGMAFDALEYSENHSDADYLRYLKAPWSNPKVFRDSLVTAAPLLFLIVPVWILVVVVSWFLNG